ncbi:putative disease resistance RPP13-like protein 1 [Corylus avellana]|uniref:putative disease resistance RPP13-like protein 1 n=1 Tax=Corylus avellana TaxID=13451 RepID=UPI00286AF5C8|nr:putative disease resistance RPP13-like protein 1 [Corylus avellana]
MTDGLGKLTALQTLMMYSIGKKKKSYFPKQKDGLDGLDGLHELRGELRIKGLEHLRSSPPKAKAAHLEKKRHLKILKLEWDPEASDYNGKATANDEQLLEHLQPHHNLKQLIVNGYAGVRFPFLMSLLSNLVSIFIYSCKWCRNIPPLKQFPSLKILILLDLSVLEYISNDGSDVSSSSLQRIRLEKLPKLRGWSSHAVTVNHGIPLDLFPCLSSLSIIDCPIMSPTPVRVLNNIANDDHGESDLHKALNYPLLFPIFHFNI